MLHDTPADVCAICLDGTPVGTAPSGACKGEPACEKCLEAIREAFPSYPEPFVDDTGLEEERYEARVAARGWQ